MDAAVGMQEERKSTSLTLAIVLSAISFIVVFVAFAGKDFGVGNIPKIVKHPEVFQSYIAQAVGGSLGLPALTVLIFSIFKSKRNPNTRRKIFISWALLLIIIEVLTILSMQ